jgi:hypothetical protein
MTDIARNPVHFGIDRFQWYDQGTLCCVSDWLMTGDTRASFRGEIDVLFSLGQQIFPILRLERRIREGHFVRRLEMLRHDLIVTSPAH